MRLSLRLSTLICAMVLCTPGIVLAETGELSDYTIEELLSPCVEADNDARWGAAAEAECEQYLRGFTDAYILLSGNGDICLPAQNRDDEVRWAFMKWAKQHYDQRGGKAARGLMTTLEAAFPCD